ncbi:class I SAM-dependent methyltransferase [Roseibium sp. SCPC15]|uniref:class I SAM-dependent methyltransferase n=1 Tax=Roseibium sp. SCP15 TaxID=3141376 RepID=UPI0033373C0E
MPELSSLPIHQQQLRELELTSKETTTIHWPRTRDSEIKVMRDEQSGVVFLEHMPDLQAHYESKTFSKKTEAEVQTREGLLTLRRNDDLDRRFEQTKDYINGRSVCDFGTGRGLYLDKAVSIADQVSGVEIRQDLRDLILNRLGSSVPVYSDISLASNPFDIVTLFHVLEHIPDQIGVLKSILSQLAPGGRVFVEVPHARDFLTEEVQSAAYCDFTYWSEHLVLHTKKSLETFLRHAGFVDVSVTGFQRYGLANHMYWLQHGKPGGHEHYSHLVDEKTDAAYRQNLINRDKTDTLVAVAVRP